jgi:mycofactocin precursor
MSPTLPIWRQPSLVGLSAGTVVAMEQDNIQDTAAETTETAQNVVVEELLVEEISIDGMCGVY